MTASPTALPTIAAHRGGHLGLACLVCLVAGALGLGGAPSAVASPLTVAISPDIPPYVLDGASGGLEVDLLRAALPEHELDFVQLPYGELQTAVADGRADVAVGVQHFADDGVHYSRDVITFANVAAVKRSAGLEIDAVGDLAGHRVLTWQDADRELGAEFEALFSPRSPHRIDYVEIADQEQQVRDFWAAEAAVAVIDRAIFEAASARLGHDADEVVLHHLFPPATDFKVGFADAALRDAFDQAIGRLCASGDYDRLLARYAIEVPRTICAGS